MIVVRTEVFKGNGRHGSKSQSKTVTGRHIIYAFCSSYLSEKIPKIMNYLCYFSN